MSGYKICKYCGEYKHQCHCDAAKAIKKLHQSLTKANEELVELRKDKARLCELISKKLSGVATLDESRELADMVLADSAITAQEKMK